MFFHFAQNSPAAPKARAAALLLAAALGVLFLKGYSAFRSDHMTQVPMLMRLVEPDLFARDWFFGGRANYAERQVFLAAERALLIPLRRIELVLFSQYLALLCAFATALWLIARRFGRAEPLFLLWMFYCATANRFADISVAPLIEDFMVPRFYSYVGGYLAIALLLRGRAAAAGLALGALGLFQGAPALQILPILVLWLFFDRGRREAARLSLLLLAGFLSLYWLQFWFLRDLVSGPNLYSEEEQIRLLAYIRHPHHMLPHLFRGHDYEESLALLVFFWAGWRRGLFSGAGQALARLVAAFLVFLLASVAGIYFFRDASFIAFQPMRMFAPLRLILLYSVALHTLNLLRGEDRFDWVRGGFLLLIAYHIKEMPRAFAALLALEAALMELRARLSARAYARVRPALSAIAFLFCLEKNAGSVLLSGALAAAILVSPALFDRLRKTGRWLANSAWPLPAVLSMEIAALAILLFAPFRAWDRDPATWTRLERAHYRWTQHAQIWPSPVYGLEVAGEWAARHTPPGSLFVIPPGPTAHSFHIWSRRSVVFITKTFPFVQTDWPQWVERYLATRGVMDPAAHPEAAARAMTAPGARHAHEDLSLLSADYLIRLARRYGAEYVVSPAPRLQAYPGELKPVAGPFYDLGRQARGRAHRMFPYYIYQVPEAEKTAPPIGKMNP